MPGEVEKRLLKILADLPPEQAAQLFEFAEFLLTRHGVARPAAEPLAIPRPRGETVVHAIKRLRETYPMLDPAQLLHETTALMTQHVTQGRAAVAVIDELEGLFRAHYERRIGNKRC